MLVPPGCRLRCWCRPRCNHMPLCAAICRSLERKWRVFLGFVLSCQRGGRRFEPGLVLQIRSPVGYLARRGFSRLGFGSRLQGGCRYARPTVDGSEALSFILVRPSRGIDEAVVLLNDHAQRCVANIRGDLLGVPSADECRRDVRPPESLLGISLAGLNLRPLQGTDPSTPTPVVIVERPRIGVREHPTLCPRTPDDIHC